DTPPAPEYQPAGSELLYDYAAPQKPEPTFRPKGVDCTNLSYQGVHVVQSGQTLFSIARQYNSTVGQLRSWNKLGQKELIKPCQSLYVLPPNSVVDNTPLENTTSPEAANETTTPKGGATVLYRNTAPVSTPVPASNVQPTAYDAPINSDAVYSDIAKQSEILYPKSGAQPTDYDTFKAAAKRPEEECNKLSYDGVHIVQKGETLYSIALANDLTVDDLKKYNQLTSKSTIKPCTSLYVAAPANVKAAAEKAKAAASPNPDMVAKGAAMPKDDCNAVAFDGMHIVRRGETLYSIAKANDLTVKQLQTWNKLGENGRIVPCMSLYVKTPEAVIAKANNTVPAKDGASYTIPSSEISTGYTNTPSNNKPVGTPQVLANAAPSTDKMWNKGDEYHVVKKGETLSNLAKMYGFTLERFRDINGLGDSNIIRIGQVLRTGNCLCPADGVGPTKANNTTGGVNSTNTGTQGQTGSITTNGEQLVEKGSGTATQGVRHLPNYDPTPVPYSYETEAAILNAKRQDGTISYRNGRRVHTVQENETMAMIANKYSIPIELLRQLNKMEKNEIVIPDMKIYLE
ncbi:MAG: LysM peptidoglycan-binding domain-containing protein, partial [Bacteroidota bacterium]